MTLSFVLFLPSSGGNQSITKLHLLQRASKH